MHKSRIFYAVINIKFLKNIITFDSMGFYYLILVLVKLCRLAEDLLGDLQLADIVKETGNGKSINIPVGHTEPGAENVADQ